MVEIGSLGALVYPFRRRVAARYRQQYMTLGDKRPLAQSHLWGAQSQKIPAQAELERGTLESR